MYKKCTIIILFYFLYLSIVNSEAPKNYGAFNVSITRFDICKGPKQNDCASSSATILSHFIIKYEINVEKDTTPTKGKIVAISNGKEFLRLQVKKPCEHLFLRPLFGTLMNVTDDCVILKGHYKNAINIHDIARSYFGGTFLFGNWTFKALFYNDQCNFSCTTVQVSFFPANKET